MNYTVKIIADENDADYIEQETIIDCNEIYRIKRIVSVIWSFPRRWYTHEQKYEENDPHVIYKGALSKADIDFFDNLVPYSEFGIHTIKSVEIRQVDLLYKLS